MKNLIENLKRNRQNVICESLIALTAVLLGILIFSCFESIDDSSETPTLEAIAEIEAVFFTEGSSKAPVVNWKENKGTFVLTSDPVQGLSIDQNTGVLCWTKDLPIGEHIVEITAINSKGSSSRTIVINNPLQGTFRGLSDFILDKEINKASFKTEMKFTPDGNMTGSSDEYQLVGNWKLSEGELYVEFTFDPNGEALRFSVAHPLSFSDDAVYLGLTSLLYVPARKEVGNIHLCMGDCEL
ncbi:hypothetical protein [Sinomicrobium sp.]